MKAIQILKNGIETLEKSLILNNDESFKSVILNELEAYNEALKELEGKEADKINDCENNCIHRNSDKIMDYDCFECSRYYADKFEARI